jgi:peptide/nickel transport system permease protein
VGGGLITMSQIEEPFTGAGIAPAVIGTAPYPSAPGDGELRDPRVSRVRYAGAYLARRPGLVIAVLWMALVVLAAFLPGLIAPDNPLSVTIDIKTAPSWHHLFGTDEIGRDLFSRVVYGSQLTMRASLIAIAVGLVLGAPLGLLSGYAGGWLDSAAMRLVDVLLAIPSLLLSLAVIIALGFGITNVAFAVGLAFVGSSARVTRGEVLKIRQNPYVEAAVVGGARRGRVLFRHVLPNAVAPVLTLAALEFGEAILAVAALSFLGFGVQPPAPEWGALVNDGRDYLNSARWLTTLPGLTIVATVLAANRISRAFGQVNR